MAATSGRDDSGSDLQPDDVASATFSTSFRGFDPGEVRAYLSRLAGELRSSQRRLKTLSEQLEELEDRSAPDLVPTAADTAVVEQQRMTEVLGAEAARVLATAHDAAGDIRARAEEEAETIRETARQDATTTRSDAETEASEIVANADRLLVERSEEADASAAEIISQAETEREEMRQEGRHMVSEARIVRQRILKDMAKRRNQGRVQLEQLRAGRDRLQDSYGVVRRTLEEATTELANVVDDARIAADRAGRQVDPDDLPSDEALEAEVVIARDAGLTVPPPDPRLDGESTNEFDRRLLAEAAEETVDDVADDEYEAAEPAQVEPETLGPIDGVATGDVFGSETPEDGVDFRRDTDEEGPIYEGVRILGPAVRPSPGTVTSGVIRPANGTDAPTGDEDAAADDGELDDPPTWRDEGAGADEPSDDVAEEPSDPGLAPAQVADVEPDESEAIDGSDAADEVEVADGPDVVEEVDAADQVEVVDGSDVVEEFDGSEQVDDGSHSVDESDERVGDEPSEAVIDLVDEPVIDLRDSVLDPTGSDDANGQVDAGPALGAGALGAAALGASAAKPPDTDEGGEPEQDIDSLFARLKESSAEVEVEPDAEVEPEAVVESIDAHDASEAESVTESVEEHSAPNETPGSGDTDADHADAASDSTDAVSSESSEIPEHAARVDEAHDGGEGQDEGELDHQDRVMVVRRDAMVDVAVRDLARHLKRVLSDDQNELLELLRSAPTISVSDLIAGERPDRLDEIAHTELVSVFSSGASYARPTATPPDAGVSDLSRELADRIDGFLNDRLTRAADETSGDSSALAERVRATYREVRTREINRAAEHAVLSAFARGGRAVAGPDDVLRWVANGCGPDCLDNSLAGTIGSSEEFPTGHSAPPAHDGCRCLLVVVEHSAAGPCEPPATPLPLVDDHRTEVGF